jgi:transcription antitermination factor NusG
MSHQYYAMQTRTGLERKAAAEVAALGITVWCPLSRFKVTPRNQRNPKPVTVTKPLLPGYFFAAVPDDRWHHVQCCDSKPKPFLDPFGVPVPVRKIHELSDLMHREETGEFDKSGEDVIDQRFNPGDLLKVMFGQFTDWEVRVVSSAGGIIKATAFMFGADRELELDRRNVRLLP